MSDSTGLGDRMKRYEAATRTVLVPRTYTVCRVDLRAGHSYLRGCARPFDERFMRDMDGVAEALCAEITGAFLAYTQSDEVSVLYTDFGSEHTEPWFGGVVAKQTSIAASIATASLNAARSDWTTLPNGASVGPRRALFDARVFTIPSPVEAANYLLWRQRDAVRNSVSMAAQAHISHSRLQGVNAKEMQEILWKEHGVNWSDYPDGAKRGRLTIRHSGERDVTWTDRLTGQINTASTVRTWWETSGAPHFTTAADGILAATIPDLPRFGDRATTTRRPTTAKART